MELVANFTLNNETLDAQFDISEITNFDALFQIDSGAMWGGIGGNIHNQEDLQNELDTLSTQITNINTTIEGYGDIVTYDTTYFATATQGALADTAIQTIKVNGTAQTATNKTVNITVPSEVTETTVANWGFTKNQGTVTSVNNILPVNGNVTITIPDSATWGNITGTLSNQTDLQDALNSKVDTTSLASVATTGSYADLTNKPTIGDGALTIQRNGTAIGTFKANATSGTTVNISVPTTASDVGAVPTSRTVNGKALSSNITLNANDVGALPSTTTIGAANTIIQRNNTAIGTINANQTDARTINISVPTTATEVGALPSNTTIDDLTTPAEQAALRSGVTTSIVTQVGTNATNISTINGKIPAQASSSNQLADKNFVNSSISTNTAYFIGTFNSVAELEAYSGTLTNNDYAFVTGTDEQGNTYYDRYKWNGTEWLFEYELNNSSFTADQWAAINSGINDVTVTQIATNTSAISSKQDKLTAGTNIQINGTTISATDTTYVAGSGIAINGNTISNTQTSAVWGNIQGTLSNQTDLQTALSSKQNTLVAGDNVQINSNTISATDTTYSNGTGLNLSNTTFSVDFTEVATASQGGKADTALQPNDNITQLNNNAGYQANVIETIKVNGTAQSVSSKTVNISVPSAVTENTVSGWGFTKNVGTVTSVNNVSPVNGNVTITIPTVPTNVSAFNNDAGYITNSAISNMQTTTNLVTTLTTASTDTTYPSAKCVYDIVGNIETALNTINSGS